MLPIFRSLLNLLRLNESLDGVLGFGCGVNGLKRLALDFRVRLFGSGSLGAVGSPLGTCALARSPPNP
jgi:hypothetical protein